MKNNWEVKKIGELCNLTTGGTPSRNKPEYFDGGQIRWLVSGDIHKKEIYDCDGRITEEGLNNSNARFLPINSVLIALNGQGKTRGTVALLKTKATCNQSLVSIYPKDTQKILPEYIFCNLHGRYEEIRKITGDDDKDRRGLNMPLIRDIDIPVPPLPEQQRIVAILDEAFAAIGRAKENAEKNLQNTRELFDSYLQSVFANPGDDWEEKTLGEVTNIQRGSSPRPKGDPRYFSNTKTNFNWITISDISSYCENNILLQTREWLTEEGSKQSRYVDENEFIIAVSGSTTGKCCITGIKGFIYDGLAVVKIVDNKIEPKFLLNYMMGLYSTINNSKSGAAFPNINTNYLKNIPIPLPSLKTQQRIVSKFDALSAETKKLENIYRQKIKDLDELKKSILQKAFSGELTAKKQVSNVIEFPVRIPNISPTDLQAGIVATAFQRHHQKGNVHTFGHVKAEKIVHLAQEVLNIELEREPVKDAAGPNDYSHLLKVESRAEKAGFFRTEKKDFGYSYTQGSQFEKLIEKTKNALGDKTDELIKLIDLFVSMNTQQAELVATVYAAWNNLLIDNLPRVYGSKSN